MHRHLDRPGWAPGIAAIVLLFALSWPVKGAGKEVLQTADQGCQKLGWFPANLSLKDHSIFWYSGSYYLISNNARSETQFLYARSKDLCQWKELAPVLSKRTPGAPDGMAIWAPFVYQENGIYYLFYTGVTQDFTQRIFLATSTHPDNPDSWESQGIVFQPNHPEMVWEDGKWADCRDASIFKIDGTYYLYYTGRDLSGSIVGLAVASSPAGPWLDWGKVVPPAVDGMLESPTLARFGSTYYLFYHHTSQGEFFRESLSPRGPWQEPQTFRPGWAHEVWQDHKGNWFTSYLTDYSVTISPITWDPFSSPPRPWVGEKIYYQALPALFFEKQEQPELLQQHFEPDWSPYP